MLFIWAGHLYSSTFRGLGHKLQSIISLSGLDFGSWTIISSLHLQLSLALIAVSTVTFLVAHEIYSIPAYAFISYDYVTTVALFVHHNWIASLAMVGAMAHAAIYLLRDYVSLPTNSSNVVFRILAHKQAILSHLSWVTLFLGFHTLGLYIHNDVAAGFGQPYKQLLVEPVFSQYSLSLWHFASSSYHKTSSYFDSSPAKDLNSYSYSSLGPGDFVVYHAIALSLHVTALILLKGALDFKGTALLPDKSLYGFRFPCDGPARGGTCDISAWDSFYLASFWSLNANSWILFFFHWKHLLIWQSSLTKFDESSTFLCGWFRDYLWFNSASLIRGYDPVGANDLSVWAWTFLAAHLCWAIGFMFLISWRGYWQELIDSIIFMHLKTFFLVSVWKGGKLTPSALSIIQARFIDLVHFAIGFIMTYAAFILSSTS